MIHKKLYVFVLVYLAASTTGQEGNTVTRNDVLNDCVRVGEETLVTFPGWPFRFDCNGFEVNDTNQKCFVSLNGNEWKPAEELFQLNVTTSFTVALVINDSSCQSKMVTVELRSISTRATIDAITYDVDNNVSLINLESVFGDPHYFDCFPPSSSGSQSTYKLALPPTYSVTWWRSQRFENGSISRRVFDKEQNKYEPSPNRRNYTHFTTETHKTRFVKGKLPQTIQKFSLDYFDPAVYSCELRYGDETAFVVHQSICVEKPIDYSKPTVMCTERHPFLEGDNVTLDCSVHSSNAMIAAGEMVVEWTKEGNNVPDCANIYEADETSIPADARFKCSIDGFQNRPSKCFYYVPTNEEVDEYPDKKDFSVELQIRNAKKDDQGLYRVLVTYLGKSDFAIVELEFNRQEELKKIVSILGGILAALLFIFLLVLVVWWNWIQIQLFMRRHLGKYDEDGKKFVAILSYVYSDELNDRTREQTKKIVKCIQEKMEDMDYKFYDSHKDFEQGSTVENLLKSLNESHRMIVILTEAYVEERWTMFEAQQGFHNMLKNRTKLIFVRTPGAKKALSKYKKTGGDFSSELTEAMKASRNIRWTDKMSDSRFKDHVQYALPNLKRFHLKQQTSGEFVRFDNYERSVSRQTNVSTVSSIHDVDEQFLKSRDALV